MDKEKEEKKQKTKEFKKRLYIFVLKLIKFIEKLPEDKITKIICDQLLRSGTSILANYIEAQSASSKKDYINFLNHSLKSSNESKVWISLLKDSGYANIKESLWILNEINEFSNIFAKSILTLKEKLKK